MNQPLDAARANRLRQRLWGAAVLIAILVIVLPLLLDGSGSDSRFRRVENLRAEPPVVMDLDGMASTADATDAPTRSAGTDPETVSTHASTAQLAGRGTRPVEGSGTLAEDTLAGKSAAGSGTRPQRTTAANGDTALPDSAETADTQPVAAEQGTLAEPLTAWVVQVGSFTRQPNALAMRDSLRQSGFPTFTALAGDGQTHRVKVGPFVERARADQNAARIETLLGRDVLVLRYP